MSEEYIVTWRTPTTLREQRVATLEEARAFAKEKFAELAKGSAVPQAVYIHEPNYAVIEAVNAA